MDKTRVQLLAEIVKKTNALIVLHSGWRFWFDDRLNPIRDEAKHFVMILEQNGLKIFDKTPDLTTDEIRRTKQFSLVKAKEILLWIEHHKDVQSYIVLDDLDLNNNIIKNSLIMTNATIGLSEENVLDAIARLNGI
ncbi:HAD domain-containing protein [Anaerosporobacter sp.]